MKTNYHTHTIFSDGSNTPEEIVKQAIALKMDCIGFSDHAYTAFDESYCISKDKVQVYIDCISALKAKYKGQIEILCGVEQEYYSEYPTEAFDYVIGSVHYLKIGALYVPVDEDAALLQKTVQEHFGGDAPAMAECYFETVSDVVQKTHCDIIGHFDLVSLFNQNNFLFDESDSRYIAAWKKAADALLATQKPFEINTRAYYRGKRDVPYPAPAIADYIASKGGSFVLSSDAHCTDELLNRFEEMEALARQKHYRLVSRIK